MSEVEDIEHAIRQVVEELIVPELRNLKTGLRGFRDEASVGFDALEVRAESQGKAHPRSHRKVGSKRALRERVAPQVGGSLSGVPGPAVLLLIGFAA